MQIDLHYETKAAINRLKSRFPEQVHRIDAIVGELGPQLLNNSVRKAFEKAIEKAILNGDLKYTEQLLQSLERTTQIMTSLLSIDHKKMNVYGAILVVVILLLVLLIDTFTR